MLNNDLLKILVCPACRGELEVDNKMQRVICRGCNLGFPIRDDIPVMLIDEAERISGE
jgi:uncharacterized protein YbaR (Trm112 family)